jgi:hypothetical protein
MLDPGSERAMHCERGRVNLSPTMANLASRPRIAIAAEGVPGDPAALFYAPD